MPSNLDERQEEAEGYVVPKQTRREADDEEEIPFSLAACLLCSIVCLVVLVVVIALPLVLLGDDDRWGLTTTQSISPTLSPTALSDRDELDKLGEIHQRGTLRCGVAEMPARAELNPETGEYEGFSVDFCKAVAAAVLGRDKFNVEIVIVEAASRFMMLQNDEVDLLASWDTHTMERDLFEPTTGAGFSFSIPYYYTGLAFAGLPESTTCADSKLSTNCSSATFCVVEGTTYDPIIREMFPASGFSSYATSEETYRAFANGNCNVLTGNPLDLVEPFVRSAGYTGEYVLGDSIHSKEPLALVTRDGDPKWSDFVNWVVESLLTSEERNYTQLMSLESYEKTKLFGELFSEMFVDVLYTVGNYAELHDRHFENILPRTEVNGLNKGQSGLMYSVPFGSIDAERQPPFPDSTIGEIKARGRLRCGVSLRAIFAIYDNSTDSWSGFDVDFCRALSAALFEGDPNRVDFIDLPATIRFIELSNGNVDVLSRLTTVTFSRDVYEPTSNSSFSFARPNFYDGLSFGGIPPYGQCADELDVTSDTCVGLKTCVTAGTTFESILSRLFPSRVIVLKQSGEEVVLGLRNGDCNAIAGGVVDVSRTNVREAGQYDGEYEQGKNRFSKDPLALVTRQDDQQWSSFVFWTVMALVYADEQGISSADAAKMPINNMFGPEYSLSFRHMVEAVGSYGDIYNRTFQEEVARGGPNVLNTYPYGPQHFSLPGLS